jgi:hypothetical protein
MKELKVNRFEIVSGVDSEEVQGFVASAEAAEHTEELE